FDARCDAVLLLDLYAIGYDPRLRAKERRDYYSASFEDTDQLEKTERLILVFPTWWFGLPAILKGWIDRSFLPGIAYNHASDLSALTPRLHGLKEVIAITTLGSPRWVDLFVLRRPVRRALKWGVFKACAPKARFSMLSLYSAEAVSPMRLLKFETHLHRTLEKMK
ncbi:MAG: NAD(P)H-dependent oxidoreductase, partial [Planktotalea sp.]|uniref:NAD(P)H-dependent oxidoreductase n=1 Tax=Planktotalea sp. TaxID=2029877 RepID=UPI003C7559D7